jgi:hypothetical protein
VSPHPAEPSRLTFAVLPKSGNGLLRSTPGILIAAPRSSVWIPLADAWALSDAVVDLAEQMDRRHNGRGRTA